MDTYNRIMALSDNDRDVLLSDLDSKDIDTLEQEYADMLDEVYEKVNIAGHWYDTSTALISIDPVAYRCGFSDWLGTSDQYTEIGYDYYLTTELDNALDALDD